MKKVLILTILFLFFAINAKAGLLDELPGPEIMPDSFFYPLKILYEKIITFVSFGDIKKAERYSEVAERRLYEAEKMAEKGKEKLTEKLLAEYEKFLNKALKKAEKVKKEAEEKAKEEAKKKANEVIEKISESILKNQEVLFRVYQLVPEPAKAAIERVIELTKTGYERAIDAVSGIKKEELKQKAEEIKARAQELIKDWQKIFGD